MTPLFAWLFDVLDERLRVRGPARSTLQKVFPHHWSFLLGEVALFAFILLVATGIFLTMFYAPSVDPVTYQGSLEVYTGEELPAAFESILRLSYDVPGGLLFRRLHRGAAYLFIGGIAAHLLRILLTGAFRRPREVNYLLGVALLILALALAGTGQSLPYDVVEGAALRIVYSFLLGIPLVGEQVGFWVFGGEFFGDAIPRFYVLHILILPGVFAALLSAHLLLVVRQRHTQFPREDIDGQRQVVGTPMWPSQFATSTALAVGMTAVLAAFASLVPWSDVALHGPAQPGHVASGAHPDIWLFWLEGALVLYPPWEWQPVAGVVISGAFIAGILLPAAVFAALAAYPFIDRRIVPVHGDVHVLQTPTDVPLRAALVVGLVAFLGVLSLAGIADKLALGLGVAVEHLIVALRVALLTLPVLAGAAVARLARTRPRR